MSAKDTHITAPASAPESAPAPGRNSHFAAATRIARGFLPLGAALVFLGYWGPWLAHPTAGLTVLGLDVAEFIKFLPGIRNQTLTIWREAFYLPAVAISLNLALSAWRPAYRYPYWLRLVLVAGAIATALTLLPPAWSPGILLTPEFQLQTLTMVLCVVASLLSPFLAHLPRLVGRIASLALALAAGALPLWTLYSTWPEIAAVYAIPIQLGWGPFLVVPGLAFMVAGWWLVGPLQADPAESPTHDHTA
ncbi:MAG: hypothetical protein WDZ49_07365 [Litorilinea sp.]